MGLPILTLILVSTGEGIIRVGPRRCRGSRFNFRGQPVRAARIRANLIHFESVRPCLEAASVHRSLCAAVILTLTVIESTEPRSSAGGLAMWVVVPLLTLGVNPHLTQDAPDLPYRHPFLANEFGLVLAAAGLLTGHFDELRVAANRRFQP